MEECLDKMVNQELKNKILIGTTKDTKNRVYLEAEIRERIGNKRTTKLKKIDKYKTLSILGHSKYFAGQIYDELNEENINFTVPKEKVEEIVNIWKRWHLNDLHAGTEQQEKALMEIGGVNANKYTEQVNFLKKKKLYKQKGYKYGTDWLVEELPQDVENKIKKLFKMKGGI